MPMSVSTFSEPEQKLPTVFKSIMLYSNNYVNHITHATLHDIRDDDKGKKSLSSGTPLTLNEIKQLLSSLSHTDNTTGLLPENVLSHSQSHLLWYLPSHVDSMWFSKQFNTKEPLHLEVTYPNLIFFANHHGLSIISYKGKKRPTSQTKVFHAPLWNLYSDQTMCSGSVEKPSNFYFASMTLWQDTVFKSYFSHTNYDHLMKVTNDIAFWKTLGKNKFPEKHLNPIKKSGKAVTLEQWFKVQKI